jgi:hypothetical protein
LFNQRPRRCRVEDALVVAEVVPVAMPLDGSRYLDCLLTDGRGPDAAQGIVFWEVA